MISKFRNDNYLGEFGEILHQIHEGKAYVYESLQMETSKTHS
jgi:hypothetical protein